MCGCGHTHTRRLSSIDLSYPEALVAYWRIYWPTGIAGYLPVQAWMRLPGHTYVLQVNAAGATEQFLFQNILFTVGLFLFVHRFLSSSFRRFSIQILKDSNGEKATKLPLAQRIQIWLFLWWRHIVAGFVAIILAAPLNMLLSLIGLRAVLGINVAFWISILGVVLAAGPVLLKMLIGHQFGDFRFEVKWFSSDAEATTSAPSQAAT